MEWIPCKVRQPEKNDRHYIVTVGGKYPYITSMMYFDGWNCTEDCREHEMTDSVTAWVEPPEEPYKEEKE